MGSWAGSTHTHALRSWATPPTRSTLNLPPGSHQPKAGGSARSTQLNTEEGSVAATGSPYLSKMVTAGTSAFAQYLLQNSLPLCAQPVQLTALCMPCMSTACSARATADVRHRHITQMMLQAQILPGGDAAGEVLWALPLEEPSSHMPGLWHTISRRSTAFSNRSTSLSISTAVHNLQRQNTIIL